MRVLFSIFFAAALFLTGCSDRRGSDKSIAVGIAPIAALTSEVAGQGYRVVTLLPEGKNPHDYTPGMGELAAAARCRVFFTTKLPFEARLVHAFPETTRVVDVSKNLQLRPLDVPHHHDHDEHHHDHDEHHHDHEAGDPHIWLSLDFDIVIAQTICDELCAAFPEDAAQFRRNAKLLQERLADKKRQLAAKLAPCHGREFFVYHGAFGYFADTFHLKQISVEVNGRESDPSHFAELAAKMKTQNHPVLFVQKEFSPTIADALRQNCGATLVEVDPLGADIRQLFDTLADAIVQQEKIR